LFVDNKEDQRGLRERTRPRNDLGKKEREREREKEKEKTTPDGAREREVYARRREERVSTRWAKGKA